MKVTGFRLNNRPVPPRALAKLIETCRAGDPRPLVLVTYGVPVRGAGGSRAPHPGRTRFGRLVRCCRPGRQRGSGDGTIEAATMLGIPEGTVKSRAHYALQALPQRSGVLTGIDPRKPGIASTLPQQ